MKHAIVIGGSSFDWDHGKKAMDNVITKDGQVNWGAAMAADPGIIKCPKCGEYFWKEATLLKCTECGTLWNTETNQPVQPTS
jgi:Zn finger protein HypA/HybF involved in hydrogenase expression